MSMFRTLRNGDMPAAPDLKAPQVAQICAGPFFHVTGLLSSVVSGIHEHQVYTLLTLTFATGGRNLYGIQNDPAKEVG